MKEQKSLLKEFRKFAKYKIKLFKHDDNKRFAEKNRQKVCLLPIICPFRY